mgnify:CR=1 FL=1
MIGFIFKKIIGSKNDREVKKLRPLVVRINEIEGGDWAIGGKALKASDVQALAAGKAA